MQTVAVLAGGLVGACWLCSCSGGDETLADAAQGASDGALDSTSDAPNDAAAIDCAAALTCPAPGGSDVTICGRMFDVADDGPVGPITSNAACDPSTPTASGPCSMAITFYDAFDLAQNPTSPTPIVPDSLLVDGCGRFRAEGLTAPSLGFVAVRLDDASTVADTHVPSVATIPNGAAKPANNFYAPAIRAATDTEWTTSAGLVGSSFATRGALLFTFRYQASPRASVAAQRNNSAIPDDDFYFSDVATERRTVNASLATTGANGSALVINTSSPIEHSGAGNEPASCEWPSQVLYAPAGTIWVRRFDAIVTGTGQVCP